MSKTAAKGHFASIRSVVFLLVIARHRDFYEEAANSFLRNSSPCLASYKSPPRDSRFRATLWRPHRLGCLATFFYRFSAQKNTFSHLICMKGGYYFQHFSLINSNNLGGNVGTAKARFLFKSTCSWAALGSFVSQWGPETPRAGGTWKKGIFWL